jgi:hypothetical protein
VYTLLCGGADPELKGKDISAELTENEDIQGLLNKTKGL